MNYISRAFNLKKEKGWPKLYIFVDLHSTIVTPTYNRFNEGAELYNQAKEVLANWTTRPDVCLILWTSSHRYAIDDICARLAVFGIKFDHINANPEISSTAMCDFNAKPFFDIGLDDKFGFEAETDWVYIQNTLKAIGEW